MGNILFAHPNFADVDFYTPVISGGSWESSLPLANVQTDVLSDVARTTDADKENTQLHADLAVVRDVRAVVVPKHNLSRSAQARVRASSQIAFSGVRLAASATAGATSLTVECPAGSAMIRAGDSFRLAGDDTLYKATSGVALGANRARRSEAWVTGSGSGYYGVGNLTIAENAVTAPDDTTTGMTLAPDAGTGQHAVTGNPDTAFDAVQNVCSSWFVKAGELDQVQLRHGNNAYGYEVTATFDISQQAVTATTVSDPSVQLVSVGIEPAGNSWYRIHLTTTGVAVGSGNNYSQLRVLDSSGNVNYAGSSALGVIYGWGFQIEAATKPSTYKASGATSAYATSSGSIGITPALAANAADETALTALCGEYVSTAPLADSDWLELFPVVYPYGALPWGHPSAWDGRVSEEERQEYPSPLLYVLDQAVSARYWKIEIDDESNADGYVELSRLFIARGYQPTRNFGYGAKLGTMSTTSRQEAPGGTRYHDREASRRTISGSIQYVPEDEAMVNIYDMVRRLGNDRQVFVSLDPDDATHLRRHSFLVTIEGRQELEYAAHGRNSYAFQLEEVIG